MPPNSSPSPAAGVQTLSKLVEPSGKYVGGSNKGGFDVGRDGHFEHFDVQRPAAAIAVLTAPTMPYSARLKRKVAASPTDSSQAERWIPLQAW